jgi:hypothetical protein
MFDNGHTRPSSAYRGGLTGAVSVPGRVAKALRPCAGGSGGGVTSAGVHRREFVTGEVTPITGRRMTMRWT